MSWAPAAWLHNLPSTLHHLILLFQFPHRLTQWNLKPFLGQVSGWTGED